MKLSEVNQALDHKIVGGSEYQWSAWGNNARFLDYESDFAYAGIVFDSVTGTVYQADITFKQEMWSEDHPPYRWLNPDFKDEYISESEQRGIDHTRAWDDVQWIDLERAEDWLDKAADIFVGADWDTRIQVEVAFTDEELFNYMKIAHQRDITFNQLIEDTLRLAIAAEENKQKE